MQLASNYHDRTWWRSRIIHRILKPLHKPSQNRGYNILEADWDNLIVLDACRADLFEETVDVSSYDKYTRQSSPVSATPDWVQHFFSKKEFPDIVYVTGNPQISKYAASSFHALENVWETSFSETDGSVPPQCVSKAALDAHKKYPNKRLVIHFMQPHQPFLGDLTDLNQNPWHAYRDGLVSKKEVWKGYQENLELALSKVNTLISQLNGKTVVTSDHGNLIGERLSPIPIRGYGHPPGINHPALREVPWAVINGDRRKITPGRITHSDVVQTDVTKRLQQLGYK